MTFFVELKGDEAPPPTTPSVPPPAEPEPQARVGPMMKARRLELGLKHKDIARDIKIKADYLKAIEDEQFDLLPTPQYLRLFVRTYAERLGLDVQEIYAVFDTQEMPSRKLEKKEPRKELPPLPVPALPKKALFLWAGAVGLAIVIVAVVLLLINRRQPAPVSTEAEPLPVRAVSDSVSETGMDETVSAIKPAQHLLEMRALDSVWLVIQSDDDTVFWGFLEPGEARSWTARNSFRFSLSSYARAEARFDGRYLKPFLQWPRPLQALEVGTFNLDRYLDSARLSENAGRR